MEHGNIWRIKNKFKKGHFPWVKEDSILLESITDNVTSIDMQVIEDKDFELVQEKIMAINKLPTDGPFSNIRHWLYEKTKVFIPNPMKPFETDTTIEQKMNLNFLSDILIASHAPTGKINKLIN